MSDFNPDATLSQLMKELVPAKDVPHAKVTIVGSGQVGMACAFSVLVQHIASELALVDIDENKLQGEMMDLQHGLPFVRPVTIKASSNYRITEGSKICVITAGVRQKPGETRLSLVQRNVQIFKGIIPQLIRYSPNTILLVVSNPVDVLTYVAWKLSGLPQERVFGSGTNLDSARFRFLMSERLHIAPSSCHGWIIGEHGDSSVAVWSGVNVAGVSMKDINPHIGSDQDPEHWHTIHKKVIDSAYEIIRLKGYTSWAIGLSVASICQAILRNSRNVFPLSINVTGMYDISSDVYLSLPCVLGENGVTHIVRMNLRQEEKEKLQTSAKTLLEIQKGLDLA